MKLLVIIPTYNERENIGSLLTTIRQTVPTADMLVVDDSSPDGTSTIVRNLAQQDRRVHLLSRPRKEGLGKAYVAGLRWALKGSYSHVVTMDADFSHDPKFLPALIVAATTPTQPRSGGGPLPPFAQGFGVARRSSDDPSERRVVIGSRYVPGGRVEGWGLDRYLLSSIANVVTRTALGLKPNDASAGFKIYPRAFIEALDLAHMIAAGYAFQVEMLMKAQDAGFTLVEVPITFVDRRAGRSKIAGEARRSIGVVLQLASQRPGIRQFAKFALVGLANVAVDWTIYFLLEHLVGVPKMVAKFGSFVVAACNSYYFNRRWTFRSTNPRVGAEFTKFFVVSTVGALLNTSIFALIAIQLKAPDIVGLFVATAVVTLWNFFANRHWTFKPEDSRARS